MIDGEVTAEQVLDLPMIEAMNLLAMIVWLQRVKDEPSLTMQDAMRTPFREVLSIIETAEAE